MNMGNESWMSCLVPKFKRPKKAPADSRPFLEVLRELTWVQWALFFIGWMAWTCDALDFFSVPLTIPRLDRQFHQETHTMTVTITLTLLFRPVGAVIFGIMSDRYGRKWPLVLNLLLVSGFEFGAGFVQTFGQFLILRSFFGIAMGGIWSLAATTALENLPVEARGVASGLLQQGYSLGNLLAAILNLTVVPATNSWRSMYWTASGISFVVAVLRMLLPESQLYSESEKRKIEGAETNRNDKSYIKEVTLMLRNDWRRFLYGVAFMAAFSFLAHGSQDLYPTYLQTNKGFTEHMATVATMIGCCGAISGGLFAGSISQYVGRRLTIVIFVTIAGVFIPLWITPTSFSLLTLGVFWMQFGVQGASGVIPIQFNEISPPAYRATFTGIAYQLGVMASAPSAQIESTIGDHMKITVPKHGEPTVVPDYAKVQGIFCAVFAVILILVTSYGPEEHSSHFEKAGSEMQQIKRGGPDANEYGKESVVTSEKEFPEKEKENRSWSSNDVENPPAT